MARRVSLAAAAAVVAVGALAWRAPAPAQQSGVKVGVLTCNVSSGWGFVFGSSRDLKCNYAPTSGSPEHYTGRVKKFGVDIGYVTSAVIVWAVLSPTSDMRPGALAGDYVGATAAASVGVGAGANVLVGAFNKSVTLHPPTTAAHQDLNVTPATGPIN